MEVMYDASINSIYTQLVSSIEANQTIIEVTDSSVLPTPPNLLTIGYDTPVPETVLFTSINGNNIEVQRGFEGEAKA